MLYNIWVVMSFRKQSVSMLTVPCNILNIMDRKVYVGTKLCLIDEMTRVSTNQSESHENIFIFCFWCYWSCTLNYFSQNSTFGYQSYVNHTFLIHLLCQAMQNVVFIVRCAHSKATHLNIVETILAFIFI
jgi:hypothetical protein